MTIARQALPRFLQQGKADTATQPFYTAGQLVAPSAGTYTLKDSAGVTVLDALTVTIGADLIPSRAIASTFADAYDLPQPSWREVWTCTIGGVVETVEREVMICRVAPVCHCTAEDLFKLHADWRRKLPPGRASYDEYVETAWEELVGRLLGDMVFPQKVLNWWAAAVVQKYIAAAMVCREFATTEGREGTYAKMAVDYDAKADKKYGELFLKRDEDEDGVGSSDGRQVAAEPELFLTYIPPTSSGWSF